MWRIIIVAALLGAVTGYKKPTALYANDDDGTAVATTLAANNGASSTTLQVLSTDVPQPSSTTSKPLPAEQQPTSKPEAAPSELPISLPAATPPFDAEDDDDLVAPKRRLITYDQRQEGQYNIRADLENFMIVLIPPNPTEGLNLLELLTKSSSRRSSSSANKSKRKNHLTATTNRHLPGSQTTAANRFRQTLRAGNNNQNFNYLAPRQQQPSGAKSSYSPEQQQLQAFQPQIQQHHHHLSISEAAGPSSSSARLQEFIEGRTPYHVDISSIDGEQSRLQPPDRQVDVIPPPFPLSYQHLIKPFHLEAEPTVIQALPPSGLSPNAHGANNFLETYNQLLNAGLQDDVRGSGGSGSAADSNYYRVSRAIRTDGMLDTNSVTGSNSLLPTVADMSTYHHGLLPLYRAGLSLGASNFYPPIDAPHLAGGGNDANARSFSLNSDTGDENDMDDAVLDEIVVPSQALPLDDDFDLNFSTAGFINSEAKSLLGDGGLERCAPGRRRDSYGVCREIEGY